ncbi:basic proline-rich protein-like [Rissa tridactyla]|uniref:basic proline-rich protein-like n=1 Tax=Rissa tridactyla TaxID=75485 RepID=UPI0023BA88B0|nr:basic proline-rich protein-like [Rissa tridactyla]
MTDPFPAGGALPPPPGLPACAPDSLQTRPPPPLLATHRPGQRHRPHLSHKRRPAGGSGPPRGVPAPGAAQSSVHGGGRAGQLLPHRAALPEEPAGPHRNPRPRQHLLPARGPARPDPAPEAEAAAEALRQPRGARRKRCGGRLRALRGEGRRGGGERSGHHVGPRGRQEEAAEAAEEAVEGPGRDMLHVGFAAVLKV